MNTSSIYNGAKTNRRDKKRRKEERRRRRLEARQETVPSLCCFRWVLRRPLSKALVVPESKPQVIRVEEAIVISGEDIQASKEEILNSLPSLDGVTEVLARKGT